MKEDLSSSSQCKPLRLSIFHRFPKHCFQYCEAHDLQFLFSFCRGMIPLKINVRCVSKEHRSDSQDCLCKIQ